MHYLLTVLSSGRSLYLERALVAAARFLIPSPAAVYVYDDGLEASAEAFAAFPDATVEGDPFRRGMCAAHTRCWEAAAASELDWVFHLEEDFVLLRPTRVDAIADVLTRHPHLAQMALVRTPWGREIEFGGYIPQMPGYYERCTDGTAEWIETTRNWATCPALLRTALTSEFAWSPLPGCETEIGPRIIASYPETKFGLWGGGEPHAAHIGVERAPGAHGY
jgi:hypothetical protein